jgi:type I restriction enzyme M protein
MDQATHSKIVSFRAELGDGLFEDHNVFRGQVDETLTRLNLKLSISELKFLFRAVSWRVESAQPVVAKVYKRGKAEPDPLHGRYEQMVAGKRSVVEYETDSELRDAEHVPLLEPGDIDAFFEREVLPHAPGAWIDPDQPKPLRTLDQIRAAILAVEREAEGLLDELVQGASK